MKSSEQSQRYYEDQTHWKKCGKCPLMLWLCNIRQSYGKSIICENKVFQFPMSKKMVSNSIRWSLHSLLSQKLEICPLTLCVIKNDFFINHSLMASKLNIRKLCLILLPTAVCACCSPKKADDTFTRILSQQIPLAQDFTNVFQRVLLPFLPFLCFGRVCFCFGFFGAEGILLFRLYLLKS